MKTLKTHKAEGLLLAVIYTVLVSWYFYMVLLSVAPGVEAYISSNAFLYPNLYSFYMAPMLLVVAASHLVGHYTSKDEEGYWINSNLALYFLTFIFAVTLLIIKNH